MRFEAAPESEPGGGGKRVGAAAFPGGLRFAVELAEDVPVTTAAAGDPVRGVVAEDLVKKVLARKGSAVGCRIMQIRRFYTARNASGGGGFQPVARVELLLRLEALMTAAGPRPLVARPFRSPANLSRGAAVRACGGRLRDPERDLLRE